MRTGRPKNADTPYKVIVHTNGKCRYAATKSYTLSEDGHKKWGYKHWGRLLEGNKFHPLASYFYASKSERDKLIFPKDWDLSEINNLEGNRAKGRPMYEADDVDRQYGTTWLLDNVARVTGLYDDLVDVFKGNMQKVNDVLTLAYFPFIDNLSYNQLAMWQREVKAPSEHTLTSPIITRLAQSITEQERMDLFRCRAVRMGKDEYCALDSTSISAYGFNLVDIRWGKNKEKLPLRQTIEVVVYSLTTHLPIYYKELPGNMPDSRTIELIMIELRDSGFKNLILITDRGYESMKNLENYIAKGQKVITSVKVSGSEVMEKIRSIDMSMGFPSNMTIAAKENLYYSQYDMTYDIKGNGDHIIKSVKYKLNLYFNPAKRAEAMCDLQHAANEQADDIKGMIQNHTVVIDVDDLQRRYNLLTINLSEDKKCVISFEINQEKMNKMLLSSGFFASKTLGIDCDPLTAKDNYGMRDEQEKVFALQKGPLGQDRLRTWSEASKHGRMFICFIGLILASYVRSVWKSNKLLQTKFKTTEAILAEMRTIRCIEHNGRAKFITPFVGAQTEICKAFGFEIPEGCSVKYTSKRVLPVKRGRKPKAKTELQEL